MRTNLYVLFFLVNVSLNSQEWTLINSSEQPNGIEYNTKSTLFRIDPINFTDILKIEGKTILNLPSHLFSEENLIVETYQIFEENIAKKYHSIFTFKGKKNHLSVYGSSGPSGLYLLVHDGPKTAFIEPTSTPSIYQYIQKSRLLKSNAQILAQFQCNTKNEPSAVWEGKPYIKGNPRNQKAENDLYRYRLAMATTGEFGQAKGNTKIKVMEEIVKIINRVNAILERDLGVTLQLIDNTDTLFYLDGNSDPYTNGNTDELIKENPSVVNNIIKTTNYDIGHVFGTNSGGQAWLEGACGGQKAAGATGTFGPYSGNLFYIIVAHEFGHQLGATHAFNRCDDENESSITAYEPGSGSTIMCYAGASNCGVNYIQNVNDEYFHVASIEQIRNFTRLGSGNKCAEILPSDNTSPIATIISPPITHIPVGTPFELVGIGSDSENDNLSFCWEEFDLGPKSTLGDPSGDSPLFRSFPPVDHGVRSFPRIIDLLNNKSDVNEIIPTYERNLRFRFTVRDNNSEVGLVDWDEIAFKTHGASGPFEVDFANESIELAGGIHQLVNWRTAGTNSAPVSCQYVHIIMSYDGGLNFTDTLAFATENDGAEYVLFPQIDDAGLRLKIMAADNIFFDVSNANFSIKSIAEPTYSISFSDNTVDLCSPGIISINVESIGINGFDQDIALNVFHQGTSLAVNLSNDTILPGAKASISFQSESINSSMLDVVTVQAISLSDTITREINLIRTPSNFSGFKTTFPINGAENISSLPILEWVNNPDAEFYEVQLAQNPRFDSLISSDILADTFFKPVFSLNENSIYYWRVKPINSCAAGNFTKVSAFQTKNINCTEFISSDTPKTGSRKIESVIKIDEEFPLVDINLPNMAGLFEFVGNIDAKLIHSDGTTITLFKDKCSNRSNFDLGFDDESSLEISCPLTDKNIHKPEEALSIFRASSSLGDWTLQINDNGGTTGGSITNWILQLCTDLIVNPPVLTMLDTLRVNFGQLASITSNNIVIEDLDTEAENLLFTITQVPNFGLLNKNDLQLNIGDQFSYRDILDGSVFYQHTGDELQLDFFSFLIEDGFGGWIPITEFPISIDQTIGVKDHNFSNILIFPNPIKRSLHIHSNQDILSPEVSVFNLQGQLLFFQKIENLNKITIELPNLPSGLGILRISTSEAILSKKILISN